MDAIGPLLLPRLTRAALTMWLVLSAVFVFLRLSGDPVRILLPANAPIDKVEALRAELGLTDSIPVQYARYAGQLSRGDFGDSLRFHQPALDLVLARFPATLQLAGAAMAIAILGGITLGALAAYFRGTWWDRSAMAASSILQSSPSFVLAIGLILVFSVHLGWLPTSGYGSFQQLALPAFALCLPALAALARMTRSSLLDVLQADYIRTARAKGLRERTVGVRHAMRNASLPIVTMLGLELADLLTGAVIIETVFAWPGIGRLAVEAVATRDYPVIQASVLLIALVYIGINLLLDIVYPLLDPRIRRD
jgi:peptide/nickel transport system permease protein